MDDVAHLCIHTAQAFMELATISWVLPSSVSVPRHVSRILYIYIYIHINGVPAHGPGGGNQEISAGGFGLQQMFLVRYFFPSRLFVFLNGIRDLGGTVLGSKIVTKR